MDTLSEINLMDGWMDGLINLYIRQPEPIVARPTHRQVKANTTVYTDITTQTDEKREQLGRY